MASKLVKLLNRYSSWKKKYWKEIEFFCSLVEIETHRFEFRVSLSTKNAQLRKVIIEFVLPLI